MKGRFIILCLIYELIIPLSGIMIMSGTNLFMLCAENLYHAGYHSNWRRKPKHFCGAGSHHYQCEEPASTVGERELQCCHPWKHHKGHTHSCMYACTSENTPFCVYVLMYIVRLLLIFSCFDLPWLNQLRVCLLTLPSIISNLFSLCPKYTFESLSVCWNISKHVFVWCCKRILTVHCMC